MTASDQPRWNRRTAIGALGTSLLGRTSLRSSVRNASRSQADEEVTLGFTGDVMLARGVEEVHENSSSAAPWGDLRPRLRSLDALCINLECCLSERGTRWPDRAFYFRADPDWSIPVLQDADVTFASLANNHVLDYGEEALVDTLRALDDAGIEYAGAGRGGAAARRPATFVRGNLSVAVIALTDNAPAYGANDDDAGTWYVDIGSDEAHVPVEETIEALKRADHDFVIASVHWGPNWIIEPADRYQEFAHWLVESGVDLVHGHSAHVFQGIELYQGVPIIHDAGEFLDDYRVYSGYRNDRSFLFEAHVIDSAVRELRLLPIEIQASTVHEADESAAAWSRSQIRRRSRPFGTTFERDGVELVVDLG